MEKRLLEILACPICKGELLYDSQALELICKVDKLAYPIKDGIPVLIEKEARELND